MYLKVHTYTHIPLDCESRLQPSEKTFKRTIQNVCRRAESTQVLDKRVNGCDIEDEWNAIHFRVVFNENTNRCTHNA